MAVPFVRPLRHPSSSPTEWAGPLEGLTLRECYVTFLLCTLPESVRTILLDWLLDPTDLYRWPPPDRFLFWRLPLAESEVKNKTLDDYRTLLRKELSAIRQTLDFPPQALSGIIRYGLLVAHGIRLRQIVWAMWPTIAEREVKYPRLKAVGFYKGVPLWATCLSPEQNVDGSVVVPV